MKTPNIIKNNDKSINYFLAKTRDSNKPVYNSRIIVLLYARCKIKYSQWEDLVVK